MPSASISNKKRPSPNHDHDSVPHHKRFHHFAEPCQSGAAFPQSTNATSCPVVSAVPASASGCHPGLCLDHFQRELKMLFETEYQDDVVRYMHYMDAETRPSVETIDVQPELQWYMRPYLIDFLIEIHQQYRLRSETLYLAVNIIDRYVSKRVVFKKHYQLVGCSALWIAAKFEDSKDRIPTVSELGKMCCGAYEESSFLQMEGHVLSTIGWKLGHPTCEAWLRVFSIGAHRPSYLKVLGHDPPMLALESPATGHLARFIMELSLFHRSYVGLRSSHVAAGALLLSRYILGHPRRPEEESKSVMFAARLLDAHLGDHFSSISKVVLRKYSHVYYSRASTVVKDWYHRGFRLQVVDAPAQTFLDVGSSKTLSNSTSAPDLTANQTVGLAQSGANVTLSSSTSSSSSHQSPHRDRLTPSSLSSLSLNSSPTSSVSSFGSSSVSSPQSSCASSILAEQRKDLAQATHNRTKVAPVEHPISQKMCRGPLHGEEDKENDAIYSVMQGTG